MTPDYHLNKVFMKAPLKFDDTYVFQIGRLYCKSSTIIEPHIHKNLFEITVVTDGCGIITTNGDAYRVERGDIYLSFPCDTHKIESDTERPLKYDFFAFATEHSDFCRELEQIMLDFHDPERRTIRDERISALLSNAIAEIDDNRKYSAHLLSAIFHQIIIYLIRGFQKRAREPIHSTVTRRDELCYHLMNYIDTHIFSMQSLTELAVEMGYSYAYLSAVFKQTTSHSLFSYYQNRKLEIAAHLIREDRMKITEIAEQLNYASVYAFSKAFTNAYGVSPLSWRKKCQALEPPQKSTSPPPHTRK